MPNYNLAINAQFQPFSMQELLAPVMGATASLREVEDAYSKQQTEADQLEYVARLLEQEGSPESMATAQKYRNYQNQIQQAADELMETGQISKGRKTLWDMTRKYGTDVLPLKAGYEQLAADMKTQTTPGFAHKKRVSMSDLASYIADPMGVNREHGIVDLNEVAKASSNLFSTYQKALRLGKGSKAWDDMTDILQKQRGLTMEQAERFLDDHDVDSALSKMYDLALGMTGADESWSDYDKIINTIDTSLWNAVGATEASLEKNQEAYLAARTALSGKKGEKASSLGPLPARDLFVVERNEFVNNNSKYFTKDSSGNLSVKQPEVEKVLMKYTKYTPEEVDKILNFDNNKPYSSKTSVKEIEDIIKKHHPKWTPSQTNEWGSISSMYITMRDEIAEAQNLMSYFNLDDVFTETSNEVNIGNSTFKTDIPLTRINVDYDKLNKLINESPEKAETLLHKQSEYYYQPDSSDSTYILQALRNSLPTDGKFAVVDRKSNKDHSISYKDTGKYIKVGELIDKDYTVSEVNFGSAGYVVKLQKGNDVKTVRIPKSRLTDNLDKIFGNLAKANEDYKKIEEADPYRAKKMQLIDDYFRASESELGTLFSDWYRPNKAPALKRNYSGIGNLTISQIQELANEQGMSFEEALEYLNE